MPSPSSPSSSSTKMPENDATLSRITPPPSESSFIRPPPEVEVEDAAPPSRSNQSTRANSTNQFSSSTQEARPSPPPLQTIISLHDFDTTAQRCLTPKTYAFYSSAATDLLTHSANRSALNRITLIPRILRNVRNVSTATTIQGHKLSLPLFVSPAALAGLVHPDGEKAIARACVEEGVAQCISSNASFPLSDILSSMGPTQAASQQPYFFQLYVNKDRAVTRRLLESLLRQPCGKLAGIMITVDSAVPGKREADERLRADETTSAPNSGAQARNDSKGGGLGRVMGAYIDAGLCWEDLAWIRGIVGPDVPLILKGVMCAADAKRAAEAGMQGIVVSNHGGRNLDTAPASILVLLELQRNAPEVFERLEVYVDGGVRRGTDVLKCLALGATAVGVGRSVLYSLVYGEEGVRHCVGLLRDELETAMRLMGVKGVGEITRGCVNTGDVDYLVPPLVGSEWKPKSRM